MTKPSGVVELSMPERVSGEDKTWDQLGVGWQAVDGVLTMKRLYVKWTEYEDGRTELTGLCIDGTSVTGELLRSIPVGRLALLRAAERIDLATLEPLLRRNVAPRDFADQVARYYRAFSRVTPHPAKAMAEHSGVPVTTVHGWIHEARLCGKLPPGTRGRAG